MYKVTGMLAFLSIVVMTALPCYGQEWAFTYYNSLDASARSVQQTFDAEGQPDGFAVAGFTASFQEGGASVWVSKLRNDGTLLWQKRYANTFDLGYAMAQTKDGGYIVTGFTESEVTGRDVWVLKLNGNGNIDWEGS